MSPPVHDDDDDDDDDDDVLNHPTEPRLLHPPSFSAVAAADKPHEVIKYVQ